MKTCMHEYIHTCIHTYKSLHIHTYIHTYIGDGDQEQASDADGRVGGGDAQRHNGADNPP